MHTRHLVPILVFACAFSQAQSARAQAPASDSAKPAEIASVPPPAGWKSCPRCQNETDRKQANVQYKVDGHKFSPRDLSGVWGNQGVGTAFRTPPPFTPSGQERFNATLGEKNAAGEPLHSKDTSGEGTGSQINCDPKGWPRLHTYNYGFEFVMLPDRVLQFFEITHTWRTIWTDGRALPVNPEPRWYGYAVGHWNGDTFIVESSGYEERSWLDQDGHPHSDQMRVVEQYRRSAADTMEVTITLTDPKIYTEPWVSRTMLRLNPTSEIGEYFCVPSDEELYKKVIREPAGGVVK